MANEWPRPKNYRPFAEDTAAQVEKDQRAQKPSEYAASISGEAVTTVNGKETAKRKLTDAEILPSARAKGGPVKAGKKYLVGEKGPEVFVPKKAGHIVPNKKKKRKIRPINYGKGLRPISGA